VTPQERRALGTRILLALRRDIGQPVDVLAELLGATVADVRSAAWALYAAKQVDWCGHWLVLRPPPKASRRPA
jgi:hypothetical protein